MKSPKAIWILLLLGTSTTLLSMNVGLTRLEQRGSDAARDAFVHGLFNDDYLRVPIQHSKVLTTHRVGYAGDPSPLAEEFVGILRTPQAEDILAHMAEHGSAGGRLYALCGLTAMRSSKAARFRSSASTDAEWVALLDGCAMSAKRVKDAVTSRDFWRKCELLVDGVVPNPALPSFGPAG